MPPCCVGCCLSCVGRDGVKLCMAEDAGPRNCKQSSSKMSVPRPSTYIQVLRISRMEKGIPRSYLQT